MNISGFAGSVLICLLGAMPLHAATAAAAERWSTERANQWYARQPWEHLVNVGIGVPVERAG
jgi:hypothetical protein